MTDLREARLVDLLPKAVADRQEVKALSDAWHDLAVMTLDFSDRAKTYTGIDQAPEVLLDILAVQFRVDWYRDDYPVETKRELIKTAMEVHRHCGTRWTVEKALSLIYPKTSIKEWFEYGGQPGYWRLNVDITDEPAVYYTPKEIEKRINYARRCSAHLEGVTYEINPPDSVTAYVAAAPCSMAASYTVRLPGIIQPRAVNAAAYAAGAVGASWVQATVALPDIIRPKTMSAQAYAAGKPVGTYETVTIKIGGTSL